MELYPYVQTALVLILVLSLPVVIVATVVGLVIGILQALTQIQDQTLPHAVKLTAVAITIIAFGALLSQRLLQFTVDVFDRIAVG